MTHAPPLPGDGPGENLFLPRFCELPWVFAVVVGAQLLAFVLVLAQGGRWDDLGLVSLFVQWIALTGAAALCLVRPWLARLGNAPAAAVSYAVLLGITLAISEAAWRLLLGEPALGVVDGAHGRFLLRSLGVSAVISAVVLRYLYVQHQWKQQVEAEARARVDALQARIRPHFLFNSLNTIAALTRSNPEQAEEAVTDLADLFRMTLGDHRQRVALDEELAVARRYVHMEQLRLGARLQVDWRLGEVPGAMPVPPLLLQPLIENAVYHGIEPRPDGGRVGVAVGLKGDALLLTVENPLADGPDDGNRQAGNRMALDNIRQRLALAYGERARLSAGVADGHYRVHIRLPREET